MATDIRQLIGVTVAVGALVGLGASAARAETYSTPGNEVVVGTDGSDARAGYVGITQGGCAVSVITVAVGPSGHECEYGHEANGWWVGVGVLGADSAGLLAVSDWGTARAYCVGELFGHRCAEPGVAVSGAGNAVGDGYTVSGLGSASTEWDGYDRYSWGNPWFTGVPLASVGAGGASGGMVSVAVTGDAQAGVLAVTVLGDAYGPIRIDPLEPL